MEIVLHASTFVEIGFLVLGRKVQILYFVYIMCASERLLLLVVECRERSGRNNGSDLAMRFGLHHKIFRLHNYEEEKKIAMASLEFQDYVPIWWEQVLEC